MWRCLWRSLQITSCCGWMSVGPHRPPSPTLHRDWLTVWFITGQNISLLLLLIIYKTPHPLFCHPPPPAVWTTPPSPSWTWTSWSLDKTGRAQPSATASTCSASSRSLTSFTCTAPCSCVSWTTWSPACLSAPPHTVNQHHGLFRFHASEWIFKMSPTELQLGEEEGSIEGTSSPQPPVLWAHQGWNAKQTSVQSVFLFLSKLPQSSDFYCCSQNIWSETVSETFSGMLTTVVLPVASVWTLCFFLAILITVAKAGKRRMTKMDEFWQLSCCWWQK